LGGFHQVLRKSPSNPPFSKGEVKRFLLWTGFSRKCRVKKIPFLDKSEVQQGTAATGASKIKDLGFGSHIYEMRASVQDHVREEL
jgi:hypothetical protein